MPGPVSDSYDPEFGTGANAADVRDLIDHVRRTITHRIGPTLKNIVEVAQGASGGMHRVDLSEQELRAIRFCLDRALEDV